MTINKCNMARGVTAADSGAWGAFVLSEGDPLFAELACGKPSVFNMKDSRGKAFYWICCEHKKMFVEMAIDSKDLDENIRRYELERDSYASDPEAVAFYNRIIAGLRKRGHVCDFSTDNNFKCPVCGEAL